MGGVTRATFQDIGKVDEDMDLFMMVVINIGDC